MSVNRDELKELIEGNLFGEQDFSLDDLMAESNSEEKIEKSLDSKTLNKSNNEIDIDLGLEDDSTAGALANMFQDMKEDDLLGDLLEEEDKEEIQLDEKIEVNDEISESVVMEIEPLPQLDTDVSLEFGDTEEPEILKEEILEEEIIEDTILDNKEVATDDNFSFLEENFTIGKLPEPEISKPETLMPNDSFSTLPEANINNFGFEELNSYNYIKLEKIEAEIPRMESKQREEIKEDNYTQATKNEPVKPEPEEKIDYVNVKPIEFPILEEQIAGRNFDLDFFSNIPVKIEVYLGQSEISLKEVYELSEGSIIELDKIFGEPLELKINGQLVARGEVVAVDSHYGIMLKEIVKSAK